eukprot:CAMPEP_0198439714 /NCGR_PEP_ID=MMETSP1452-20131203/55988_1 /TAXON_ID=1181717 /ORGANISM="Synchroma pusillum, Strain CCMP3072" /LENGTH=55 /DNA_ID=CAMNT_0044160325 /DNA_START=101 /DNA_END=265 /DNA_ORIENTATION=+
MTSAACASSALISSRSACARPRHDSTLSCASGSSLESAAAVSFLALRMSPPSSDI